jgi:OPA family glycerol-3-phosphate transporter-like MFS transporter 1/2
MLLSSLAYMLVALSYALLSDLNHVLIIILMCINGFFQCTGWPGLMAIIGNWFDKGKMGVLLGIWAINANIGILYYHQINR